MNRDDTFFIESRRIFSTISVPFFAIGPLVVAGVIGSGCSSSSSGAAPAVDGGDASMETEAGEEAGRAPPPVGDASVCEGALVLPPAIAACAAANCCAPVTACFGDSQCALLQVCEEECAADGGAISACVGRCESSAQASSVSELHDEQSCLEKSCGDGGPGDAGAAG